MKTNFHNKNFALILAFIIRLKATRKWSIEYGLDSTLSGDADYDLGLDSGDRARSKKPFTSRKGK